MFFCFAEHSHKPFREEEKLHSLCKNNGGGVAELQASCGRRKRWA